MSRALHYPRWCYRGQHWYTWGQPASARCGKGQHPGERLLEQLPREYRQPRHALQPLHRSILVRPALVAPDKVPLASQRTRFTGHR
jgi:hypothetical protein